MRVELNRPLKAAASRRDDRTEKTTGRSFADMLGETEAPAAAAGTVPVGGVSALLTLQEVPDATERRRRAVKRGEDLLARLDDLRLGLLDGRLVPERLAHLARTVREARVASDDPRLEAALAEIELRAAVELAKLEAAADEQAK